jgi:hypothetical protein
VLQKAMSRRPEARPLSVLELVREFQAIETELGVPQTPIEVAMDDWALATVSDLEDRTRIRAVAGAATPVKNRRRRRLPPGTYSSVGTVLRQSVGGPQSSGTSPIVQSRGMQALAWVLVASAVLVIGLGATATLVLIKANTDVIPKVTDISAATSVDAVTFSWSDPGLRANDSYQITTNTGGSSIQTAAAYRVDAKSGDRVCITVTVNREGKTGGPSGEKCVDFGG